MSQLNAAKHIQPYYPMPKTWYEHFVNKKWSERDNIFLPKIKFIEQVNLIWKGLSEDDKKLFMDAPPPLRKKI